MAKQNYKTTNGIRKAVERSINYSQEFEMEIGVGIIYVRLVSTTKFYMGQAIFIRLKDILQRCSFYITTRNDEYLWLALYI